MLLKEIVFRSKIEIEHTNSSSHPPKIHVKAIVKRIFLFSISSLGVIHKAKEKGGRDNNNKTVKSKKSSLKQAIRGLLKTAS